MTQADLNWDNEKVRQALYEMVNYWIQFGVDGFRFDVINLISKDEYKNSEAIGKEFYTDGPRVLLDILVLPIHCHKLHQ
ncbi:hypothetical protein CCP1ISM_4380001 [Azospirillaceae bacterium]